MTKKHALLLIMTITLTYALFGQYFDYISLGYNTITITDENGMLINQKEFLLNDKRFPKMELLLGETNVLKEERKQDKYNRYYIDVHYFLSDYGDSWDELEEGYHLTGYGNQIYRIKNGKLVFVHDGAEYDSKKIEYSIVFTDDIKVTMEGERYGKKHIYFMHFYNVPEETIYKKFMRTLCKRISHDIYYYNHDTLRTGG